MHPTGRRAASAAAASQSVALGPGFALKRGMTILPTSTRAAGAPRFVDRSDPARFASSVADAPEGFAGPDWRRMRHAVRRYRWFILVGTALSVGAGWFAARFVQPTYTADIMLAIDGGARRDDAGGPLRPQQAFDAEAWTSLLRSYTVLEGAAIDARSFLQLRAPDASAVRATFALAPTFRTGAYRLQVDDEGANWTLTRADEAGTATTEQGAVGDSVGRAFGFRFLPPSETLNAGRLLTFTVAAPRDAAAALRRDLDIRIDEQASFLSVGLSGPDPLQVARTLNALGARFIFEAAALKQQSVGAYRDILAEQVASASAGLTAAERALEQYRVGTATYPVDMAVARGGPTLASSALFGVNDPSSESAYLDLRTALDATQRDREALDGALAGAGASGGELPLPVLQRIAAAEPASELATTVAELATKRAELRTLRYRYADANPAIQRVLRDIATLEGETIPALVQSTSQRLRDRERALTPRVATSLGTLRGIPSRDREEGRLRRNAMLAEQLYASLQQRYDGTRLAQESAVAEVRMLDQAVAPRLPSKDLHPAILLFSLVGGLLLAVTFAILLDRSDARFRYPDQVTKDLGLTILGAVPHVRGGSAALQRPGTSTPFLEALRDIRLSLSYAHSGVGPLHLAITSPGSADGKSFLAMHLARAFADGGARTLLIDGDMRRGVLHERLNIARRPGLSELLKGTQPLERVMQRTAVDRLDLITSGGRQSEAAELLGTPDFTRLLDSVQSDYDVVICDSPPLSAGVDAVILAAAMRNLVLVVRSGVSQREVAAARLELVRRLPVRVMGAILNDVPPDSAYSYYSHYALPGYDARTEEPLATVGTADTR